MAEHRITSRRGIDIWLTQQLQMSVIGRRYVEAGVDDTFFVNGIACKATETQFGELGSAIYAIYFGSTHLSTVEEAFNEWIARHPNFPVRASPPVAIGSLPKSVFADTSVRIVQCTSTFEQQVLKEADSLASSVRTLIENSQELALRLVYMRAALQIIADNPYTNVGELVQTAKDAVQWLNDREAKGGG